MKRVLAILVVLASVSACAATRRALVIGIGDYPAASGWTKINGDKDIPMVVEMLTANGFSKQNIAELKNEQATCAAICCALDGLIACSQTGDFVYIHFSGHGQQITGLNGDEDDGLDEAWIPYDAQFAFVKGKYEGENHLVDDQLNAYLHRLRRAVGESGQIVVISDACHSGDGTRDADNDALPDSVVCRGTATAFVVENVQKAIHYLSARFRRNDVVDCSHIVASKQRQQVEWIHISACGAHQTNYEYRGTGSLTAALFAEQQNLTVLPLKQLKQRVGAFIRQHVPFTQTPQYEGRVDMEHDTLL